MREDDVVEMVSHLRCEPGDLLVLRALGDDNIWRVSDMAADLQGLLPDGVTVVVAAPGIDIEVIKASVT